MLKTQGYVDKVILSMLNQRRNLTLKQRWV